MKMTPEAAQTRLPEIPDWTINDGKLYRVFKFKNFAQAFGFMASIALIAEKMDHHPEWSNIYSTVTIALSTHDVNGISEKDFVLAAQINELL